VFDNLISNSVKYGRLGSTIVVRLRGEQQAVRLEVQDQSEGIPESELGKVFEAFLNTSSQTTGGETSTGLGLSIARSIVEAHGGTISVSSTIGVGSQFAVNLPRHLGKHDANA
jgi:signal transduction histidine kinase